MASISEASPMRLEDTKKNLFITAMNADWIGVLDMYRKYPETHTAKITRSGDTALHIAISDGREQIVEQMIQSMISRSKTMAMEALKAKNERGNSPLHLAAILGNVRMCTCIACIDTDLIGLRNKDSETPFFLAALHGRKDAFLCLHSFCKDNQGYSFCRRNDGDNILHCAIAREHFDLAFQIIHLYGNLVNYFNAQGFSPLHLLASKPSAFKSASRVTGYKIIIYHFIIVDKLEPQTQYRQPPQKLEYNVNAKYPENYQTCVNFGRLMRKVFRILVLGSGENDGSPQSDDENPSTQHRKQEALRAQQYHSFPATYLTCFDAIKLVSKAMLIVSGLGSIEILKLRDRKQKHLWSAQVLDGLLKRTSIYEYEDNGRNPQQSPLTKDDGTKPYSFEDGGDVAFSVSGFASPPQEGSGDEPSQENSQGNKNGKKNPDGQKRQNIEMEKRETPILIAAKNGVVEMVQKILLLFPVAIHDMNSDKKNIVLLAAENRQAFVYQLLLNMGIMKDSIFRIVDKDGNSALHLAASLGEFRPWFIPGGVLQMQWEIKWYEYVKNSMPLHFFERFNKNGETPDDVFTKTHEDLVKSGSKWLTNTSQSCSVVAALIVTVAFPTSATVPGGVRENIGTPTFENEPAFDCFAISSMIALCFSVTSLVVFLSILSSRYQEKDFRTRFSSKLFLLTSAITSLFISIASMLISFFSGHFFVLKDKLKYAAFPVYALTCLPLTLFAVAQFPFYLELIGATFEKVPHW